MFNLMQVQPQDSGVAHAPFTERRRDPRVRSVFRVGLVSSATDQGLCRIMNISDHGAMLRSNVRPNLGDRLTFRHEELLAALAEAAAEAEQRQAAELKNQTAVNIRLSQREREVLAAVARGLQSKQIAWELGISVRTVHLHRSNAMAKLGVRNSSQAIAKARSLNLLKDEFPVAA